MTAQIHQRVVYQDREYDLIGVDGTKLPTPEDFGMEVVGWSTACYHGHTSTFALVDDVLILTDLHIGRLKEGSQWKTINGIEPIRKSFGGSVGPYQWPIDDNVGRHYVGLNIKTDFTGGILIGSGFVALFKTLGFQKPHSYKKVFELLFENGLLTTVVDHSEQAETQRNELIRRYEGISNRREELLEQGFSGQELHERLYGNGFSLEEGIMADVNMSFSLDYKDWFL